MLTEYQRDVHFIHLACYGSSFALLP